MAITHSDSVEQMWVDIDRPQKVEDMVLDPKLKATLAGMVNSGKMTNVTLSGKPGIGKTTLAFIIANSMSDPENTLFVPCGVDGTISTVRTKITDFCQTVATPGVMKVVILDEFDSMSGGGVKDTGGNNSAQKALRSLIEAFQKECRFVLTCNSSNSILKAILSRCPLYDLTFDKKAVWEHVKALLAKHGIEYGKDDLVKFWKSVAEKLFPDIRGIVNNLQAWCTTGRLVETSDVAVGGGPSAVDALAAKIVAALSAKAGGKSVVTVRKEIAAKSSTFGGNYQELVSAICRVDSVAASPKAVVSAATYSGRMPQVSDPELQMFAFLYSLKASLVD